MLLSHLKNKLRKNSKFKFHEKILGFVFNFLVPFLCLLYAAPHIFEVEFFKNIDARVFGELMFKLRENQGMAPKINSQLRLFSYDDTTVDRLERADLTSMEWALILKHVSERKPRAIFLDKLFSTLGGPREEADAAAQIIATIDVPIQTIVYTSKRKFPLRHELEDIVTNPVPDDYLEKVPMEKKPGWHIYGPHRTLSKALPRWGHAHNAHNGEFSPFVDLGKGRVLPHVSLSGPFPWEFNGDKVYYNGTELPIDAHGMTPVNFFRRLDFFKSNYRVSYLLNKFQNKEPVNIIQPGDVVVILPAMFTGGSDFINSPLGPMPGGYVISSVLNSVLNKDWIRPVDPGTAGQMVTIVAASLLLILSSPWNLLFIVFALAGTVGGAAYLFVYENIFIVVTHYLVLFTISSFVYFAIRVGLREKVKLFMLLLEKENSELHFELDQAKEIAKVFIPEGVPEWRGLAVDAYNKPYMKVSGDWFAFDESTDGRYKHVVLCDITGHGAQAAIVVSACKTVQSILRDTPAGVNNPFFIENFINLLNKNLYYVGQGRHLSTLVGVTLDMHEDKIHFISCGHPPPFYWNFNESPDYRALPSRHSVLGLKPSLDPKMSTRSFRKGSNLMLFSDGCPSFDNPKRALRYIKKFIGAFGDEPESAGLVDYIAFEEKRRDSSFEIVDDQSLIWICHKDEESALARPGRTESDAGEVGAPHPESA